MDLLNIYVNHPRQLVQERVAEAPSAEGPEGHECVREHHDIVVGRYQYQVQNCLNDPERWMTGPENRVCLQHGAHKDCSAEGGVPQLRKSPRNIGNMKRPRACSICLRETMGCENNTSIQW